MCGEWEAGLWELREQEVMGSGEKPQEVKSATLHMWYFGIEKVQSGGTHYRTDENQEKKVRDFQILPVPPLLMPALDFKLRKIKYSFRNFRVV